MSGRFRLANPAALKEFDLPADISLTVKELAASLEVLWPDGNPRPVEAAPLLRALNGEIVVNEDEIVRPPASDKLRYRQVSAMPVRDAAGQVIGAVTVVRDITERKRAEEDLKVARDSAERARTAAEEASRAKDHFLAILAHELRTPLAPIRTGLDLVNALRGDAAACEEPLKIMDRQLDHLVHLLDDLLDVSRISRGRIELHKERLDLAEIIHAALEISDGRLSRGERRLTARVPSEPLAVEGDRVRLVQVIANVLNNAAKFTVVNGRIDVRVTPQGEQVEIRVQDDGRGIPRERLESIFEMFSQVEPGPLCGLAYGR